LHEKFQYVFERLPNGELYLAFWHDTLVHHIIACSIDIQVG